MRIIGRKSISVSLREYFAVLGALRKGQLSDGPDIGAFERDFARYTGNKYAIAVPSARLGIQLVFRALGGRAGEKAILSAYNFPVIPRLMREMGVEPVFVDIDPVTWNIDCTKIQECIDVKTRYLLVTHMFGQPCDMEPIVAIAKKYGLKLVEDCAHACGAEYKGKRVGSFGDAACFSFGLGKGLVTFGGGMVVTNDENLHGKIKSMICNLAPAGNSNILKSLFAGFAAAFCTKKIPYMLLVFPLNLIFTTLGLDLEEIIDTALNHNVKDGQGRFTNAQAAIGLEQLKNIDYLNDRRIGVCQKLGEGLRSIGALEFPYQIDNVKNVHLYFPLKVERVRAFKRYLIKYGIDVKRSGQTNCAADAHAPVAESHADCVIELPNYPCLSQRDIAYMTGKIRDFFKEKI